MGEQRRGHYLCAEWWLCRCVFPRSISGGIKGNAGFDVQIQGKTTMRRKLANILLKGFQIPGYKTFLALDFRENIINVPKFSKTMGIHYRAAFAEISSSFSFSAHRRVEVWSQLPNPNPNPRPDAKLSPWWQVETHKLS